MSGRERGWWLGGGWKVDGGERRERVGLIVGVGGEKRRRGG